MILQQAITAILFATEQATAIFQPAAVKQPDAIQAIPAVHSATQQTGKSTAFPMGSPAAQCHSARCLLPAPTAPLQAHGAIQQAGRFAVIQAVAVFQLFLLQIQDRFAV